MDSKCATVCAVVASNVYGAQGVDPDICEHIDEEIAAAAKELEDAEVDCAANQFLLLNSFRRRIS